MTDVISDREFSRKSFLTGGGALVVGFSLGAGALAGTAATPCGPHRTRLD